MKKSYPAAAFVVAIILTMISGGAQADTRVILADDKSGAAVSIRTNDVLEIRLEGNPITGYLWSTETLDTGFLEQTAGDFQIRNPSLIGSGGFFIFRFKALKPGETILALVYQRPFEKDAPQARYRLKVVIQE